MTQGGREPELAVMRTAATRGQRLEAEGSAWKALVDPILTTRSDQQPETELHRDSMNTGPGKTRVP